MYACFVLLPVSITFANAHIKRYKMTCLADIFMETGSNTGQRQLNFRSSSQHDIASPRSLLWHWFLSKAPVRLKLCWFLQHFPHKPHQTYHQNHQTKRHAYQRRIEIPKPCFHFQRSQWTHKLWNHTNRSHIFNFVFR